MRYILSTLLLCTSLSVFANECSEFELPSCLYLSIEHQCLYEVSKKSKQCTDIDLCMLKCVADTSDPRIETNLKFIGGGCWHACSTTEIPLGLEECVAKYKIEDPERPEVSDIVSTTSDGKTIDFCTVEETDGS